MTIYTHTIDLETFYNGDFKTDKEILVLTTSPEPITSYKNICLQACILDPHNASVISNIKKLANTIVEKWMPERIDKYPFVVNCKVNNWLIEKEKDEKYFSFVKDVPITSIDIYKHLHGETPIVDGYYVFTHDAGKFIYKLSIEYGLTITNDDIINMVKDFLKEDLKRIEVIPDTANIE